MMEKKNGRINVLFSMFVAALLCLSLADAAFATSGDTLPWGTGLTVLMNSLTGPVAGILSLIAIVGAGAALLFGGNIQGFMRTAVYLVLVIGLVVGAAGLLKTFYSGSSANVPFIELLL
jgi:type IV secretion system protein VirB2